MKKAEEELKPKKVPGRIQILKVISYKGARIYIRLIDKEIFEYLAIFNGELYSNYMVITPKKGTTELSLDEINAGAGLIFTGAVTSVDVLLEKEESKYKKKTHYAKA